MGADPKKSRAQRTAQTPLSTVRRPSGRPHAPEPTPAAQLLPPHQAGIPDGPAYELEISIDGLHNDMEQLVGADPDGLLKLSPSEDGKLWYVVYRWTRGRWRGHYVTAVVNRGDLRYGVLLAQRKVDDVRAGRKRPTLDKYQGE